MIARAVDGPLYYVSYNNCYNITRNAEPDEKTVQVPII